MEMGHTKNIKTRLIDFDKDREYLSKSIGGGMHKFICTTLTL